MGKRMAFSEQLRRAVDADERSRYRLCKLTGISEPSMSRFMAGDGLRFKAMDKLAELLNLKIVADLSPT